MNKLYRKVFPVILQLGCDVEQVAERLFSPLVFQIIHWFTSNKQYESPDTIALLEAILVSNFMSYHLEWYGIIINVH